MLDKSLNSKTWVCTERERRCIYGLQRCSGIHSSMLIWRSSNGTSTEWKAIRNLQRLLSRNCWIVKKVKSMEKWQELNHQFQRLQMGFFYFATRYWCFSLAVIVASAVEVMFFFPSVFTPFSIQRVPYISHFLYLKLLFSLF